MANSIVKNSVSTFPDDSEWPCTFVADTAGIYLKCAGASRRTPNPQHFIDGLIPENRSFGDVLQAKRVYRLREYSDWTGGEQYFAFVVQRGKITLDFNYNK